MSDGMTHEQATEELEGLALDALDAFERDAVLAHVAGCDACRAELVLLQQTTAYLASAVAPVPMSPAQRGRLRARLLARAAADRGAASATSGMDAHAVASSPAATATSSSSSSAVRPIGSARSVASRSMSGSRWLAIAASVIAVASVGALMQVRRERDDLRGVLQSAAVERGARAVALDSLRAVLTDRERLITNLTGEQVAVMSVGSSDIRSPSGRMFWDQQHGAWTFVGHHLPAPKFGRTYQLWLVTPTAKISAGTFSPDAAGRAIVRASYVLPKNGLAAIAVTDEPSAGSAQPTTEPFLVATSGER